MRALCKARSSRSAGLALVIAMTAAGALSARQNPKLAPANAPSAGAVVPAREPGTPLTVSGVVVSADGKPIRGASLYAYQTDAEGYYGVKPASDSANPRLKVFLRTDADGRWSFTTIRPGSYPSSKAPGHIHFEVAAEGWRRDFSRSCSKTIRSSPPRCGRTVRFRAG